MIVKSASITGATAADDRVSFDEFCTLVKDGEKADLIDGVIYRASPDSERSASLTLFLGSLIEIYIAAKNINGFPFVTRFACKLSDTRAPEPDVGYVRPDRRHLVQPTYMDGGPDIAVEIISRDSRSRDYGEKRELYQSAGVTEYWIVDPLQHRVEFLRLSDKKYALVPLVENRIFQSAVIPGLWIDVQWLLSTPVPRAYQCLQEILQNPR